MEEPQPLCVREGDDLFVENVSQLPYQLTGNLGFGHTANVEKVKDTITGFVYARKKFRISGTNKERRRIFENEIRIIRRLAPHHHIVRVFATYVAPREVGLLLSPVAEGGDLEDFLLDIRETTQVPAAKRKILETAFGCLASGLAFMHKQQIRHKDIKPRNILIHNGTVINTDFGYSLDHSAASKNTTTGKPDALTRKYCAPEICDWEPRNSKSDIFSLGCVFIEILVSLDDHLALPETSQPYHEVAPELQKMLQSRTMTSDLIFFNPLSMVICSMLHRDPKERFPAEVVSNQLMQCTGRSKLFCYTCMNTFLGADEDAVGENRKTEGPLREQRVKEPTVTPNDGFPTLSSSKLGSTSVAIPSGVSYSMDFPTAPPAATQRVTANNQCVQDGSDLNDPSLALSELLRNDENDVTTFLQERMAGYKGPSQSDHTPWTWSSKHNRYYTFRYAANGGVEYQWTSPPLVAAEGTKKIGNIEPSDARTHPEPADEFGSDQGAHRNSSNDLPHMKQNVTLDESANSSDTLNFFQSSDPVSRYIRVKGSLWNSFWKAGLVFKIRLDPENSANRYGRVRSPVLKLVVVQNRGTFSQCVPVSTYRGGPVAGNEGVIYIEALGAFQSTSPSYLYGGTSMKKALRVESRTSGELGPVCRIDYGNPIVVEHSFSVAHIGMVCREDRYLLGLYFTEAKGRPAVASG